MNFPLWAVEELRQGMKFMGEAPRDRKNNQAPQISRWSGSSALGPLWRVDGYNHPKSRYGSHYRVRLLVEVLGATAEPPVPWAACSAARRLVGSHPLCSS